MGAGSLAVILSLAVLFKEQGPALAWLVFAALGGGLLLGSLAPSLFRWLASRQDDSVKRGWVGDYWVTESAGRLEIRPCGFLCLLPMAVVSLVLGGIGIAVAYYLLTLTEPLRFRHVMIGLGFSLLPLVLCAVCIRIWLGILVGRCDVAFDLASGAIYYGRARYCGLDEGTGIRCQYRAERHWDRGSYRTLSEKYYVTVTLRDDPAPQTEMESYFNSVMPALEYSFRSNEDADRCGKMIGHFLSVASWEVTEKCLPYRWTAVGITTPKRPSTDRRGAEQVPSELDRGRWILTAVLVVVCASIAAAAGDWLVEEICFGYRAKAADAEVAGVGQLRLGSHLTGLVTGERKVLVRGGGLPHFAIIHGFGWWTPPEHGQRVRILFEPDPDRIGPCDCEPQGPFFLSVDSRIDSLSSTTGVKRDSFWQRYLPPLAILLLSGGFAILSAEAILCAWRRKRFAASVDR